MSNTVDVITTPPSAGTTAGVLEIHSVRKSYGSVVALKEVSLSVGRGEFLTLLGPSGSGKTTLLKLIIGFEQPSAGDIVLEGTSIVGLPPAERGFGMVFQQYALFPHMTVAQNIAYGLKLRKVSGEATKARVSELLELLRLEQMRDRLPRQLSGGQQQRVALGRALAYKPEVILMDEPLGALDKSLRLEMEQELRRIHRDLGATFIYVTHDQQEALALSDRIAIMDGGEIVGLDTPTSLFTAPPNAFVAQFFSGASLLRVDDVRPLGGGTYEASLLGTKISVRGDAASGDVNYLAARPRAWRLGDPKDSALRVEGRVMETLLFGDELEVIVDMKLGGRITALLPVRDAGAVRVGMEDLSLSILPDDLRLVR